MPMLNTDHLSGEGGADVQPDVAQLLGLHGPEAEAERKETFRIGDLAREFGITLRTLRFYEDRGLISPERRGTTRLYSRRDRKRLRLVLLGKALGFSLTEARQMIDVYNQPNGRKRQLEIALEQFSRQKEVLRTQREEVEKALEAMDVSIDVVRGCLNEA